MPNSYTDKHKTFLAGADLEIYRRVKLASGVLVYAGAGESSVGVSMRPCLNGEFVAVKLWNDSGSFPVTASGAFALDTVLYGTADGKVSDTVSGDPIGQATEAATDGDVIEMVSLNP